MTRTEFFMRLAVAVYRIDGAYDRFAKGGGVKANTMWLLYALNDGKRHTQRQICDEWYFPRSTVNTLINVCVQKGNQKQISHQGSHFQYSHVSQNLI